MTEMDAFAYANYLHTVFDRSDIMKRIGAMCDHPPPDEVQFSFNMNCSYEQPGTVFTTQTPHLFAVREDGAAVDVSGLKPIIGGVLSLATLVVKVNFDNNRPNYHVLPVSEEIITAILAADQSASSVSDAASSGVSSTV